MRRMKDLRGSHVLAVRNAIFRTFGLKSVKGKKTPHNIIEWKQSKEVKRCYLALFDEDKAIENVTNEAFPSLSEVSDEKFNEFYIYTAAVCDIILNPDYPSTFVSKKALDLRFRKFSVFAKFIFYFKKKLINHC